MYHVQGTYDPQAQPLPHRPAAQCGAAGTRPQWAVRAQWRTDRPSPAARGAASLVVGDTVCDIRRAGSGGVS